MTGSITVTAKTGPARQETSLVLGSLKRVTVDMEKGVATVVRTAGDKGEEARDFDLTGVATVTCTITSGNYVWVIS